MLLKNLLPSEITVSLAQNELEKSVNSIEIDSRKIGKNSVFFALKGTQNDGAKFIDSAISNGASVVICDSSFSGEIKDQNVTLIKAANPHQVLVFCLQKFYANLPQNIFAVTGTNGKTSVAEFCRQILEFLGHKAASIGTLGVNCSDLEVKKSIAESSLTTPDIVSLYKNLATLKQFGVDFVTIEASSIGLEQGRMDGIDFAASAFTNFTQDHLDYHGNMDQYFAAKMILFQKTKLAVINSDSDRFSEIKKECQKNKVKMVTYGAINEADFKIISSNEDADLKAVELNILGQKFSFKLEILEDFQTINILCSLSMIASYLNFGAKELKNLLPKLIDLKAINGRMEKVATLKNNAKIYIDFAHTPDALENLLKIARSHIKGPAKNRGQVIILFGCGGDRDPKKRPIMGKIADDLADKIIVTDDNPRCEDAGKIRAQIVAAITNKSKLIEFDDRKKAIHDTVLALKANDILLIAGKGHEQYQIIGKEYFPFDERQIVKDAIGY